MRIQPGRQREELSVAICKGQAPVLVAFLLHLAYIRNLRLFEHHEPHGYIPVDTHITFRSILSSMDRSARATVGTA